MSSNKVKVALLSYKLEIESTVMQYCGVIYEDIDGFPKRIDMKELWNKIRVDIENIIVFMKSNAVNIIFISS